MVAPSLDRTRFEAELRALYRVKAARADLVEDSSGTWRLCCRRVRDAEPFDDDLLGIPVRDGARSLEARPVSPNLVALEVDGAIDGYLARGAGAAEITSGFTGALDWVLDNKRSPVPPLACLPTLAALELRTSPESPTSRDMSVIAAATRAQIALSGPLATCDLAALGELGAIDLDVRNETRYVVARAVQCAAPLSRASLETNLLGGKFAVPSFRARYLAVARALDPRFDFADLPIDGLRVVSEQYDDYGDGLSGYDLEQGRAGDDRVGFEVDIESYYRAPYFMGPGEHRDRFRVEAYGLPPGWRFAMHRGHPVIEIIGAPDRVIAAVCEIFMIARCRFGESAG